ncbi:MAG: RNA-binding protein [Alphaproteobacteria bacterium]
MPAPQRNHDAPDGIAATERRCLATGASRARDELLRFVVAPDGTLTVDPGNELPGRGLWLTPSTEALASALSRKAFQRAARQPVAIADDLAERIERVLARRCLDLLGLSRRAGQLTVGFEKVQARLRRGPAAALIAAADASADGRRKLRRLAPDVIQVELLTRSELSLAIGRENVVHAALDPGGLARKFLRETARLSGFRAALDVEKGVESRPRDGSRDER